MKKLTFLLLLVVGLSGLSGCKEENQTDDSTTFVESADSDADGLTNGEERGLGTDFENKDTDSDGYDDAWEVAQGFDPLTPPEEGSAQTKGVSLDVKWNDEPIKLPSIYFTEPLRISKVVAKGDYSDTDFYQVGVVKGGDFDSYEIIIGLVQSMGVTRTRYLAKLDTTTGNYFPAYPVFSEDERGQFGDENLAPWMEFFDIPSLYVPQAISIERTDIVLVPDKWGIQDFSSNYESEPWFDYQGFEVRKLIGSECPLIERPDFTLVSYHWDVDFINDNGVLDVTYSDGTANTSQFEYINRGCGGNCTSYTFANGNPENPEFTDPGNGLKVAGKSSSGIVYYELTDSEAPFLKNLYDQENNLYKQANPDLTYEEFVDSHPFLFWNDPLGRWIKFTNQEFMPASEKCKPVIYLYPKEPMNVHVEVSPDGGMTVSDPVYPKNGWDVYASPDGSLINSCDGLKYDSLFWEGKGLDLIMPKAGFVIAQGDVAEFFTEKMSYIGFIQPEIDDFLDYWLPRFQEYPYYFVTFMDPSEIDASAPLAITPKPDTVIRMFMDYRGLNQPIKVDELDLPHGVREGFTVTEWGGAAR